MKNEIKLIVIESLEKSLDGSMEKHNFKRHKKSLVYSRKMPESEQKINLSIEMRPPDSHSSIAALYPNVKILMPAVEQNLLSMVQGDQALIGSLDAVISSPINFLCPKATRSRWLIEQYSSVPHIINELCSVIDEWVIPFFNSYDSPHSMCAAYMDTFESNSADPILPVRSLNQILRVIAALSLVRRDGDAVRVAERYFGKAALRKKYQVLFTYLDSQRKQSEVVPKSRTAG